MRADRPTGYSRRGWPLLLAGTLILATSLFPAPATAQPATPAATTPAAPVQGRSDGDPLASRERFDQIRFNNESSNHYYNTALRLVEPHIFFFPPMPPPLDADISLLGPTGPGAAAPPGLAPFVSDWFYPQLAARLAANDLPKSVRARLDAYVAERTRLQDELRAKLASLPAGDPAERAPQLAAFAAQQGPALSALEAAAAKIKSELRPNTLFGSPAEDEAWADSQAELPRPPSLRREAAALRAAAFFEDELSDGQRGLLCETAAEVGTGTDSGVPPAGSIAAGWLLHFSPEPARLRLGMNLPAPLEEKISTYLANKAQLKLELRTLLRDTEAGTGRRRVACRQLAAAQAGRLALLEEQAEDIRRGLAAQPNPPGLPPAPALPPGLMARIAAYRAHKLEALQTLRAMLAAPATTPVSAPADAGGATTSWVNDSSAQTVVRPHNLQVSTEEFISRQSALLDRLNRELAGIREDLADYVRSTNRPADLKSINDLLKDFENARQQQEIWDKYRDYQVALLLPGLSPEQRRLLFSAAIEQLALPLPAGVAAP